MTRKKVSLWLCIQSPTTHRKAWISSPWGLGLHVVVEVVAAQEDGLGLLVGGDAPRLAKGLEVALEVVQRALGAVPCGNWNLGVPGNCQGTRELSCNLQNWENWI